MFPFVETICIEDGRIYNLPYHNRRMNKTRREVFGMSSPLDLANFICPESYQERTKCRVEYNVDVLDVGYMPYHVRLVDSLQLVVCDEVQYRYKSTDRSKLNELFAKRGISDDILIVRNGELTDTSICNIALWNGSRWLTPDNPLLQGTMRSSLLDKEIVSPAPVRIESLKDYSVIRLFNAMIEFGEIEFSADKIVLCAK